MNNINKRKGFVLFLTFSFGIFLLYSAFSVSFNDVVALCRKQNHCLDLAGRIKNSEAKTTFIDLSDSECEIQNKYDSNR
ncbi:MAG: hypothetical protein PHF29_00555 [Candidatus Riflebacteria bacterium]|nr:hypothetical protein [Candidatus Riflebacteria bacterium]MDD3000228.1 hypothetical protein [Candidatus Riflebacteria bacterium]